MNKKGFFVVFIMFIIISFIASEAVYAERLSSSYTEDEYYADYFSGMSDVGKEIYNEENDAMFIRKLSRATSLNDSDITILKLCIKNIKTDTIMNALYSEYDNSTSKEIVSKMGNDLFGLSKIYEDNYYDDPDRLSSEEEESVEKAKEEFIKQEQKKEEAKKDFWGQASIWWSNSQPKGDNGFKVPEQAQSIINTFSDMINVVGTTLIIIATIVLGIKFIFGSVENQTSAKEGLITLLVACIFFFGWQGIYGILVDSGTQQLVFTSGTFSYKEAIGNVLYVASFIAKGLLVIGVIYVGIKYIFAGAAGRAQLKGKSVYFFIGIILAFATTNVLSFISKIVNEVV